MRQHRSERPACCARWSVGAAATQNCPLLCPHLSEREACVLQPLRPATDCSALRRHSLSAEPSPTARPIRCARAEQQSTRLQGGRCWVAAEGQPASTAAAAASAAHPLLPLNSAPAPCRPLPADCSLSSLSPGHSRQQAMPANAPAPAAAAAPAPAPAAAPCWADLPPALWEALAHRLPAPDIMSLRQAWRGASQLGHPASAPRPAALWRKSCGPL